MNLVGNYYISLKFGDVEVPVSPQMIDSIVVTQDIDRLLPTFKISVMDATGVLGEVAPFDKEMNNVTMEFSRTDYNNEVNSFDLSVKRRKPDSDRKYQIEGVLNVPGLLTNLHRRAFTGNVKTNIESIASELGIENVEVGQSLNYNKTIIQPRWTNAKLLRYLSDNLIGRSGESCYYAFVKNTSDGKTLVFNSLDELLLKPVKYGLIVSHKPYEDFIPIVEYKVFDNSQIVSDLGAASQSYGYFDYTTGMYTVGSISIDDCPALAEKMLVDGDNTNDSVFVSELGRSSDFTSNFDGKIRGSYYRRINGLISMWVSVVGLENAAPGDLVKVIFGESFVSGNLLMYQHSGYWLVQRVTHILGPSFMTNLLLTRNGIDTSIDTGLLKSKNIKVK
jgi:hypothetical protein